MIERLVYVLVYVLERPAIQRLVYVLVYVLESMQHARR